MTLIKTNSGKTGFGSLSFSERSQDRNSSRNLEAGTEAGTIEECHSLACLPDVFQDNLLRYNIAHSFLHPSLR